MKYFILLMSIFTILTGCSNESNEDEEMEQTAEEQGEEVESIIRFGEVNVLVNDHRVLLSGEAETSEDVFYFTFEQGEEMLLEETKVRLDEEEIAPGWRPFELELEIDDGVLDNDEVPYVQLYGKNNGEIVDKHFVPVDVPLY